MSVAAARVVEFGTYFHPDRSKEKQRKRNLGVDAAQQAWAGRIHIWPGTDRRCRIAVRIGIILVVCTTTTALL